MKGIRQILVLVVIVPIFAQSQNIGINSTGTTPNAAAIVDISATSQGILIPRMTDAQRQLIQDPANGLFIYNTSTNEFNFYDGSNWDSIKRTAVSAIAAGGTGPGGGIAVNTTGATPDPSAILDVTSTTKGVLIPSTTTGITAVQGMFIYNSGTNQLNYYDGNSWQIPCTQAIDNSHSTGAVAQGISFNATGAAPDPSAILDISSSTQGLLIPRMSASQRQAIASPAQGLMIYDNTNNWVEYWSGSEWYAMGNISWVELTALNAAGSPSERYYMPGVWNPVANVMYVFGGWDGSALNDLWQYTPGSPGAWSNLIANGTAGSPPGTEESITVWDSHDKVMLLFGGWEVTGPYQNDLWQYTPGTGWTQLFPTGTLPGIRGNASGGAVWDDVDNEMIVFGGQNAAGCNCFDNDLWEYTPSTNKWTEIFPTGGGPPAARSDCPAVWNSSNHSMYLFGGISTVFYNDLWQYTPSSATTGTWTQLTANGAVGSPSKRQAPAMQLDPINNTIYLYGGDDGSTLNDMWEYNISTATWTQINLCTSIPARFGGSSVWDASNNTMLMFGGGIPTTLANDLWQFTP